MSATVKCPACGQARSLDTIFPESPEGRFGTCSDRFHAYAWPHPTWGEYDSAAEWCARRGLKGADGDPLPPMLSADCLALINDDPEAFGERVRATAYALAMEATHARHATPLCPACVRQTTSGGSEPGAMSGLRPALPGEACSAPDCVARD